MARTQTRASAILVVAAAVCFGTTGTAQALGGGGAGALSLGSARIVFGGALLAVVALVTVVQGRSTRAKVNSGEVGSRGHPRGGRRSGFASLALVLVGALGVAAYQPTFFTGTSQNGVAVGTLVALGSAPVLTGLLEWILLRRAPGIRWAVATAIAALGVAALSGGFSGASTLTPLGLIASLAAGLSYAVYAMSSKALLNRGWAPSVVMGATFGSAAAVMAPVLASTDTRWMFAPGGALTVAWLALITTALAYTLFARGLRGLQASRAATLTLVEPLTATVLGVAVLGEHFTASTVVGLVLLVVGLAILTVPRPRRRLWRRGAASPAIVRRTSEPVPVTGAADAAGAAAASGVAAAAASARASRAAP